MPAYPLLNLQSDQIYFELGYQSLIEPFFHFYRKLLLVGFYIDQEHQCSESTDREGY